MWKLGVTVGAGIVVSLVGGQAQAQAPAFCTTGPGGIMTVTSGQTVASSFLLTSTSGGGVSTGNCVLAGDKFFGGFSVIGAITGAGSTSFTFDPAVSQDITVGFQGVVSGGTTGGVVGSVDYSAAIDPALADGFLIENLQKDFTFNSNPTGLAASAELTGSASFTGGSVSFDCVRNVNGATLPGTVCPQTHTFGRVSQITVAETLTVGVNAQVTALTDTISQTQAAVPEPASLALLGTALAGMGFALRRRRHS